MRARRGGCVVRGAVLLGAILALGGCAEKVTAPPEPPASVRRGDRAFRDEKYDTAIVAYREYLAFHTANDPYTARIIYKAALSECRLGQYASCLATLGDLDRLYPTRRWVQVEALRGDAEAGLQHPVAAMQAWDVAWSVSSDMDRPKLRARIESLQAKMTSQQLAQARQAVASDEVAAMLDRHIAQGATGVEGLPAPAPAAHAVVPPPREPEREAIVMAEPPPPPPPPPVEGESFIELEEEPAAVPPPPAAKPAASPVPPVQEDIEIVSAEPYEAVEIVTEEPPPVAPAEPALPEAAPPPAPPEESFVEVPGAPSDTQRAALEPEPTPAVLYEGDIVMAPTPRPGSAPAAPAGEPEFEVSEFEAPAESAPAGGEAVRVACLLPLSGPAKAMGERALRGIRLVFPANAPTLVLKDTGSSAANAGRLFEEVASDPAVVAAIGPIDAAEAGAVAARADRLKLPTLQLTAGPARAYSLPLGVAPAEAIDTLLDYTVGPMRLRRFGVLHPRTAAGSAQAAAFGQAVGRRGGRIVGTVAYAPDEVATLTTYDAVRAWREDRDLQAVFVPDASPGVARFAEFLESTMPDVVLLGVQGWEQLARDESLPGVFGVLFADSFFAGSMRPATRDFVVRFEQRYGSQPAALEAEAFDAATLARAAIAAGGADRAGFLRALRAIPPGHTASGEYRITPSGVERSLFLLQISDGVVREVGTPNVSARTDSGFEPSATAVGAADEAARVLAAR